MSLVRLAYYSRNRLDPAQGGLAERVSEILAVSVANNRRADISGGLIFSSDWFAQVLEGERVAILETFARIEKDPRHSGITTIESRLVTSRRFSFWWMAAAGWSPQNADLFRQYCGGETFTPFRLDGEATCDLIEAVLRHQMDTPTMGSAPHWLSAWRNPDARFDKPDVRRQRILAAG